MKKIIFYSYDEKSIPEMLHGYEETEKAIFEEKRDLIYTTQMFCMNTRLIEFGYEIWIKERDREPYSITRSKDYDELHFLDCNQTNRQLRMAHNILKMWGAGAFANNN